ncbi:MAG: hypothetical protein U9N84_08660 [Actinomycetota bacterium]|nr:hypothetical protein [Actinomycetota bacterium]
MTQRGTIATDGRAFLLDLGLLVLGAFSILILFSFGGQVIVAPVLLPVQWLIARNVSGGASRSFSILGALLLAEVVLVGSTLLIGERPAGVIVGLLLAVGAAAIFYRTSQN